MLSSPTFIHTRGDVLYLPSEGRGERKSFDECTLSRDRAR